MDVMLTDIEAYSKEAKEMLEDRQEIIKKIEAKEDFSSLLKKYEIKYLVVENVSLNYQEIFSFEGLKIYKIS
jgi:predicted Fe-Mo cluster-binding NifX family protein